MNIFVLSKKPADAAKYLCDKHVVKMTLETCQLLCTAYEPGIAPYKHTHKNHPCTKWVNESLNNWHWLYMHGRELVRQYYVRYNKSHASEAVLNWCITHQPKIPIKGRTEFVQCMPEKYKHSDPVTAYRNYYLGEKLRFAKWKTGEIPHWVISSPEYAAVK